MTCAAISTAETARALCVWSKTAREMAIVPNHVPSRLTPYAAMIRRSRGDAQVAPISTRLVPGACCVDGCRRDHGADSTDVPDRSRALATVCLSWTTGRQV